MARELWARLQLKCIYAWQAGVSGLSNTPLVSRRSSRRRTGSTRSNARHEAVRRTRQCACAPRSAPRVQVPASDTNQSRTLQYGESENTGKLTGSRMALIERGLDAKPVSSKSQNHMQRHTGEYRGTWPWFCERASPHRVSSRVPRCHRVCVLSC